MPLSFGALNSCIDKMKATIEFLTLFQTIPPPTDSHESEFRGAQGIHCQKGYLMRDTSSGPLPVFVLRTLGSCVAGASKDFLKKNDFCLSKTIPYSLEKMPCHATGRATENISADPHSPTRSASALSH